MYLTFEEWRKLPKSEKGERYKEMSNHDRFLARLTSPATSAEDEESPQTDM